VRWSRYDPGDLNGGRLVHNGTVVLEVDGQKVVDWMGPVGRNDEGRMPHFKIGIYNPSGSTDSMSVSYRMFTQNWTIVHLQ